MTGTTQTAAGEAGGLVGEAHRSYSQLDQVRRCGESYRLARIEKVPERPNMPAVFGKVFHTVSEELDRLLHAERGQIRGSDYFVQAVESLTNETLTSEVEKASSKYGPVDTWLYYGKQTFDVWVADILPRTIRNYVEWRLSRTDLSLAEIPGFGLAIEVPFLVRFGEVAVRGYVDRVLVGHNGVPFVFDLKSGRKPETIEQLAIYRIALGVQYGLDCRWGGYLYDIKGTPTFVGPYDLAAFPDDKLVQNFAKANGIIEAGLFTAKPQEFCFHCGVREHCEFTALRA